MKTSYAQIREIESTLYELDRKQASLYKVEQTLNQWCRTKCLNINTQLNTFEQTFEFKDKLDDASYLLAIKTPILNRAMIIEFNQKLRIEVAYADQICAHNVTKYLSEGKNTIYVAYISRSVGTEPADSLAIGLNECYLLSRYNRA